MNYKVVQATWCSSIFILTYVYLVKYKPADKLNMCLTSNNIMAYVTNHFQQTRLYNTING